MGHLENLNDEELEKCEKMFRELWKEEVKK